MWLSDYEKLALEESGILHANAILIDEGKVLLVVANNLNERPTRDVMYELRNRLKDIEVGVSLHLMDIDEFRAMYNKYICR